VLRDRIRLGVWSGIVAAAATLGALLGFGVAHGAWILPLNAIAHGVFGTRALLLDVVDPLVTTTALVIHVVSLILVGVAFVLLIDARVYERPAWLTAAAAMFTIALALFDRLLPARLAPGFERPLSPGETAAVYVVFGISLIAGVRLGRRAEHAERETRRDPQQ
jgi:hypothetical protein